MTAITLTCDGCGRTRTVDDTIPYDGRPVAEWWESIGRRCQACRQPLPDPTAATPVAAGRHHPPTSHQAARLAIPRAGSQRAAILDALLARWPDGLTAYEASRIIARSPNQTATRLQELRDQGWVEYATTTVGTRAERETTPGATGLIQKLTDAGRREWSR